MHILCRVTRHDIRPEVSTVTQAPGGSSTAGATADTVAKWAMCSSRKSGSELAPGNFGTGPFAGVATRLLAAFLGAPAFFVSSLTVFCLAGAFLVVCFLTAFFFAIFFFGMLHLAIIW
jgi:hypothetical protein